MADESDTEPCLQLKVEGPSSAVKLVSEVCRQKLLALLSGAGFEDGRFILQAAVYKVAGTEPPGLYMQPPRQVDGVEFIYKEQDASSSLHLTLMRPQSLKNVTAFRARIIRALNSPTQPGVGEVLPKYDGYSDAELFEEMKAFIESNRGMRIADFCMQSGLTLASYYRIQREGGRMGRVNREKVLAMLEKRPAVLVDTDAPFEQHIEALIRMVNDAASQDGRDLFGELIRIAVDRMESVSTLVRKRTFANAIMRLMVSAIPKDDRMQELIFIRDALNDLARAKGQHS